VSGSSMAQTCHKEKELMVTILRTQMRQVGCRTELHISVSWPTYHTSYQTWQRWHSKPAMKGRWWMNTKNFPQEEMRDYLIGSIWSCSVPHSNTNMT
jgi:hypothetical protein